jgi:hypothetical protein
MAVKWPIPKLNSVQHSGKDWLLSLLGNLPMKSICRTLMTLWRIWHIRNEIVHDKQPPPMETSRQFLMSYMDSLLQIKYYSGEDIVKGKFFLDSEDVHIHSPIEQGTEPILNWTASPIRWCKLNSDGSFGADGAAGAGMIVRDHT